MTSPARTVLQSVLAPGLGFGASEALYVRLQGETVRAGLQDRRLVFKDGGRAAFDTFFNGLTVHVWRRHCAIDDLDLVLWGSGTFIVRLGLHRIGHAERWLDEWTVTLKPGQNHRKPLAFWDQLDAGMLYFAVEAVGPAVLEGGHFDTGTLPSNDVVLGIVITHFDRKRYLLPAIERLREDLLTDPRYEIEVVIVDNSRNVAAAEAAGVTVIPNANFGGSGGFMRGLLHLKAKGRATHCLFMDDDASCESESVRRAYALMQFAKAEKFAVAGCMLRELEPYRLFEKGAMFDGMCRTQKGGLDMRHVPDLLLAEREERKLDYGGWWFFGFAIQDVERYAFPFFIRGDDILFAMANKFDICTMNGIASWAEDFGLKNGPLPTYLDVRSHLLQILCMPQAPWSKPLHLIARFFFLSAFSYNYGSARAVILAVQHVAKGPDFWVDNLDMSGPREMVRQISGSERMLPIDRSLFEVQHRSDHESRSRRLLRLLTLNGFLLPAFLLKDTIVYQPKSFFASLRGVFRYRKVLYEYEPLGLGYVARHDKRQFFKALGQLVWAAGKFVFRLKQIRREYREALPAMTSEAFWRKIYALDQSPVLTAPSPQPTPVYKAAS